MNDDKYALIGNCMIILIPLTLVHNALWPIVEELLIRNEDIIAYISDFSFPFFLPMGIFIAFLINFTFKLRKLKKRENKVWNHIDKADKKEQTKWKIKFSVICVFVFIACSAILCAGILQRTVITSDYKMKNYNFTGQVSAEYEPDDIRFVKIFPQATYERHTGFDFYFTFVEIYINGNDCFTFLKDDFDSLEQLIDYKNVLIENGVKVYVSDRAANEPDSEDLSDEKLEYVENYYKEYEKLK